MKSTQAWGWLAAGVLALGLNGVYHDGGAAWAHVMLDRLTANISEPTQNVLALATERTDLFMAKVQRVAAREETSSCRLATMVARFQTKVARTQTGFSRVEAIAARHEARMARVEAERARIEAQVESGMERVRFAPAAFNPEICPRVRVSVPQVRVSVPMVHIATSGMGPV